MNIVITGVSRGLGHALALRFHHLGHTVFGCARSFDGVQALRDHTGNPQHFSIVDLVDDLQVQSWAEEVLVGGGPPALLINNAGVINRTAPLWSLFPDELDHVIDVNIRAPASVIRHFVPSMIDVGSGVIVNLGSAWGRFAAAGEGPYCASKFAIEGLTGSLALELPEGLAAVVLDPGTVDTQMSRIAHDSTIPVGPTPEEWAARAAPVLLALGPPDNGRRLVVR